MSDSRTRPTYACAAREVAYPIEHVWPAMATLLPYCSVCDVSVILTGSEELGEGRKFRAFPGHVDKADAPAAGDAAVDQDAAAEPGAVEGGMAGEIIDWSPHRSVATRLEAGNETVVLRVEMAAASPDTTLVTISVEVRPHLRSRLAAAMTRSSYARMARRTVEGEIEKLPAHLALLEEPDEHEG